MPEFGYSTYPHFGIAWNSHSLGAVLYRLQFARGAEHRRLVWWAAALAKEAGYEVHSSDECVDITLPEGMVILETDSDTLFTATELESIKTFCEQQLAGLPKPDPDAMRYGSATFGPHDSWKGVERRDAR